MPKKPHYSRGNYYHIYNRGRSRLSICHQEKDYLEILERMRIISKRFSIIIVAYVLLPNHYHFLVQQVGNSRASLLPQHVFLMATANGTIFDITTLARYLKVLLKPT